MGILRAYNNFYRVLPRFVTVAVIPGLFVFLVTVVRASDLYSHWFWIAAVSLGLLAVLEKAHTFIADGEIKAMRLQLDGYKSLLRNLNSWVSTRSGRLNEAVSEGRDNPREVLRKARGKLHFDRSMQSITQALHDTFHSYSILKYQGAGNINIRVNLLEPHGNGFRVQANSETHGDGESVADIAHLRSDSTDTVAGLVWNDQATKSYVVSDTLKADKDDQEIFKFLRDTQKPYLKSLLCFRVDDVSDTLRRIALICIDANKENLFSSEESDPVESQFVTQVLRSFEHHMVHESRFSSVVEELDKLPVFQ